MRTLLSQILILSVLVAFSQQRKIMLIGDAGEPKTHFDFLEKKAAESNENDILIFLGDNLYPQGLPLEGEKKRDIMRKKLEEELAIAKVFKGKTYFIPGNHDWAQGREYGLERVIEQDQFITEHTGNSDIFYPKNGCPGPIEIVLDEDLVLLIIDTQYYLHKGTKPGKESDCECKTNEESYQKLSELIEKHQQKQIVVAAHHPMYSYGVHGGYSNFRQHVFPLTDIRRWIYIPLPVIGSIYPLYRKWFGDIQDITNKEYQVMRDQIVSTFEPAERLIFVNGHEHSLQYIEKNDQHYILSGSGSKSSPVKDGPGSKFKSQDHGFAEIIFNEQDVLLRFWSGETEEMLFETNLNAN